MAVTTTQFFAVAIGAGVIGAALGALLMLLLARHRFASLVSAANRMEAGQLDLGIPAFRGPLAGTLRSMGAALHAAHMSATTDRLTGIANRPMLLSQLYSHVEHAVRYDRPLALLFADIDHFKDVNDTFGHDAGDAALHRVARLFQDNVRGADVVGRYGGDEIVVVLPETRPDQAASLAEKLRALVTQERFRVRGNTFPLTVSIGIAGGAGQSVRAESLVQNADAAMYSAKSMGRNQCVVFRESEDALVRRSPIGSDERVTAVEVGEAGRSASEEALLSLIFPREHFAGRPSPLIASVAMSIGQAVGLSATEVERVRLASLLHDIGKLAVPDEVLYKPGPLTPEEWQQVKQHPRVGELIVEEAGKVRDTGSIILHHHERFAGSGYPHGLRGIEIPIGARILAIADAYDAMVLDRPYKRAIDHDSAVEELRRWAGSQFDPDLVSVFCDLFAVRPPRPDVKLARSMSRPEIRAAS